MLKRLHGCRKNICRWGVEGETAALIEPYDSHAGGHGHLHLDDDELFALVASLHGESSR